MWDLIDKVIEVLLSPHRLRLIGIVIAVTAIVVLIRRPWRRPDRSYRAIFTDLVYAGIYVGGVYGFLLIGPLNRGIERGLRHFLPFLETHFLESWPFLLQFTLALVVVDGCGYFAHRLAHTEPFWSFHSIHHSQRELTPLTNYRLHLVDVTLFTLARGLGAFLLGLYGMEKQALLPAAILLPTLELMAHSGLGWSYGPLGRIFVSPRFHGVHHSVREEHYDRNFGMTFSFWDDLFRTSDRNAATDEFGVIEPRVPEGFVQQLYWPFARIVEGWRSRGVRVPPVEGTTRGRA